MTDNCLSSIGSEKLSLIQPVQSDELDEFVRIQEHVSSEVDELSSSSRTNFRPAAFGAEKILYAAKCTTYKPLHIV